MTRQAGNEILGDRTAYIVCHHEVLRVDIINDFWSLPGTAIATLTLTPPPTATYTS